MNYLLDTHTFLWFINGDKQLSIKSRKSILDPDAINYVSIATFWEIAIKVNLGKLKLDMPFEELRQHILINGFEILPLTFEHTMVLSNFDFHHGDPFDRMIIVQAITDKLTLISKDSAFEKYTGLRLLW